MSIKNVGNEHLLKRIAREQLKGVGDSSKGEWEDLSPLAFHLRRRISDREEKKIGPAIDIRGTVEEQKRLKSLRFY